MLDHQYVGTARSCGLRIRIPTRRCPASAGSHRSTWNGRSRSGSHSHSRSISPPSGAGTIAACSGAQERVVWPRAPMFHSMPPENQAPFRAKAAGWNTGLR